MDAYDFGHFPVPFWYSRIVSWQRLAINFESVPRYKKPAASEKRLAGFKISKMFNSKHASSSPGW